MWATAEVNTCLCGDDVRACPTKERIKQGETAKSDEEGEIGNRTGIAYLA